MGLGSIGSKIAYRCTSCGGGLVPRRRPVLEYLLDPADPLATATVLIPVLRVTLAALLVIRLLSPT